MALETYHLKPNSTISSSAFSALPSGTLHGVLSDGLITTYVEKANLYAPASMTLGLSDVTVAGLGTTKFVYSVRPISMVGTAANSFSFTLNSNPSSTTTDFATPIATRTVLAGNNVSRAVGGVVTITTDAAHGIAIGQYILITGATANTWMNGTWQTITGTTGSTLKFQHMETTAVAASVGTGASIYRVQGICAENFTNGNDDWSQSNLDSSQLSVSTYYTGLPRIYETWVEARAYDYATMTISSIGTDLASPFVVTNSSKPTISWAYAQTQNLIQTGAKLKIFSTTVADPETATAIWSTVIDGVANSTTVTTDLNPAATYYLYYSAATGGNNTKNYAPWANISFTTNLVIPTVPAITEISWDSVTEKSILQISANMLSNPSFEVNTTGWTQTACTLARVTSPTPQSGVGAMSLTATASSNISAITATGVSGTAVSESQTYVASAYFRSAAVTRSARVSITWYTAAGATVSTSVGTSITTSTSVWTRATVAATAPATAVFAAVVVEIISATTSQVHYVDAVQLEKSLAVTNYRDSGVFADGVQAWDVQRSDDGGSTWVYVRTGKSANSTAAGVIPNYLTIYDYEPKRNISAQYRVRAVATIGTDVRTSAWNSVSSLSIPATTNWSMFTVTSTTAAVEQLLDAPIRNQSSVAIEESVGIYRPLKGTKSIVVHGVLTGQDGKYDFAITDTVNRDSLLSIINSQKTICVVNPLNDMKYIRIVKRDFDLAGIVQAPMYDFSVNYVEVDSGLAAN